MSDLTLSIPVRAAAPHRPDAWDRQWRQPNVSRDTVIVAGGSALAARHARAAADAAGVLGAAIVEAKPGRRLAPALAGAEAVLAFVPTTWQAPLAALCEWLSIRHAGPSARAATVAADPALIHALLTDAGFSLTRGVSLDARGAGGLDHLGPVRVRPPGMGAGPTWRIARDLPALRAATQHALSLGERVWVEDLSEGHALRVAALRTRTGDIALAAAHDIAPGGLFAADRPILANPPFRAAVLDPRSDALTRRTVASAYRLLDLRGPAEFEIVLDGTRCVLGAIDPAPVLTRAGLVAQQFAASGWSYAALLTEIRATACCTGETAY